MTFVDTRRRARSAHYDSTRATSATRAMRSTTSARPTSRFADPPDWRRRGGRSAGSSTPTSSVADDDARPTSRVADPHDWRRRGGLSAGSSTPTSRVADDDATPTYDAPHDNTSFQTQRRPGPHDAQQIHFRTRTRRRAISNHCDGTRAPNHTQLRPRSAQGGDTRVTNVTTRTPTHIPSCPRPHRQPHSRSRAVATTPDTVYSDKHTTTRYPRQRASIRRAARKGRTPSVGCLDRTGVREDADHNGIRTPPGLRRTTLDTTANHATHTDSTTRTKRYPHDADDETTTTTRGRRRRDGQEARRPRTRRPQRHREPRNEARRKRRNTASARGRKTTHRRRRNEACANDAYNGTTTTTWGRRRRAAWHTSAKRGRSVHNRHSARRWSSGCTTSSGQPRHKRIANEYATPCGTNANASNEK